MPSSPSPTRRRAIVFAPLVFLITTAVACGGGRDSSDEPDAMTVVQYDAAPTVTMEAGLNNVAICPGGFTVASSAQKSDARQENYRAWSVLGVVRGLLVIFKPLPSPGATAPCFQATIRGSDDTRVNCREGSAVTMAPDGELTLSSDGATVTGDCQCTEARTPGASSFRCHWKTASRTHCTRPPTACALSRGCDVDRLRASVADHAVRCDAL